ncbi:hypothetical protein [Gemmiger formicilis]|uniref:hypothetical protein n=1 Tax=Gemmiger formicilis TaxID=745368 RepID=UPI003CCAF1F3
MMMTIALRFIPTLIRRREKDLERPEGPRRDAGQRHIYPAHQGACADPDSAVHLGVPPPTSWPWRWNAAGYHGGEGRTRLKQLKFTGEDFKCLAVIAVALVVIACTRFFVPGLA